MSLGELDGKVIIVTGSARGQGAAEVRCFVEQGARVLVSDIRDDEGHSVAEPLGDSAFFSHLDVTDAEQWAAAVSAVEQRWGRIDGLVNNAGILTAHGRMVDIAPSTFRLLFDVHMFGPFLGMRAVAPIMARGGGGSIVNITSTAGQNGAYGIFAYGATKWGLRGMTRTAAIELGPMNIRVNAVAPGSIDVSDTMSEEEIAGFSSVLGEMGYDRATRGTWHLLDRRGRPEDIARFIAYLMSDQMGYVTAQEYIFDDGSSMVLSAPPRDRWATAIPSSTE